MKTLSIFATSLVLSLSLIANAGVRHVGDGGGESELLLWQYTQFLPYWAQGCQTNPDLCWNGGVPSDEFLKQSAGLKLLFVNKSDYTAACSPGHLTFAHEDLYWDHDGNGSTPQVSKSSNDLALILVKALLSCQGVASSGLQSLKLEIVPQGRLVHNSGIFALSGTNTDMIFWLNSTRNLHAELVKQIGCDQYRLKSPDSNGFSVSCTDKQETYLVSPRLVRDELTLNVRYNSEVDF